jgi:hypothetical protein
VRRDDLGRDGVVACDQSFASPLVDGKRMATQKYDIKTAIGRSPDISDTFIMRMYFELTSKLLPDQSPAGSRIVDAQNTQFNFNAASQEFEAA